MSFDMRVGSRPKPLRRHGLSNTARRRRREHLKTIPDQSQSRLHDSTGRSSLAEIAEGILQCQHVLSSLNRYLGHDYNCLLAIDE